MCFLLPWGGHRLLEKDDLHLYGVMTLINNFHCFQVEGYYDCYPGVVQRMYFCCGVYVPTFPALRKYDFCTPPFVMIVIEA